MKPFCFFALAILFSTASFAEAPVSAATSTTTTETTAAVQNNTETTTLSPIGQRYIKDFMLIPLRSGDTPGHRIVHKGVKSGSQVSLLKVNEASQYSLVRTSDGIEGWIPTQYLMEETPASVKLAQAEDTIAKLGMQSGPDALSFIDVQRKNDELIKNMHSLEETNNTLSRELEHIKSLSSDEVKLNEDNKKLLVQYESAKREQDTLMAENQSLKDQLKQNTFINGAIAVILGILATLIIQYFAKSKKRYSDWA